MPATNDLIDRLAADLRPTSAADAMRPLAIGIGAGILVSAMMMLVLLGPRHDLAVAVGTSGYWIKFAYTLAFGLAGVAAVWQLGRPAGRADRAWISVAIVFALVALLGVLQFADAAPAARMPLVMGSTATKCPALILLLSSPVLTGCVWAMRQLAPTNLTMAGLAAGTVSGGFGAWIYAFHCPEAAIPFLALWYTLGIVAVAAFGAAFGRLMLRW